MNIKQWKNLPPFDICNDYKKASASSYLSALTIGFVIHLRDNKTHIGLAPLIAQVATAQSFEILITTE
ncbi:hypothetical protein [Psychromonas hadalis]|uniref:hypothetical protein n=1 Tax=Psychromonas hadalis TaxID=211669 RepID=UPI0003B56FB3|nr:hypothetical protein [Psychromonas hadalis]